MTPEDILSDITADLVEFQENTVFLERLFSFEAGEWVDVESLCGNLSKIGIQLKKLREAFAGAFHVTWLDYPKSAYGKGYCVILFFAEDLHFSRVALYNRTSA